MSITSVLRVTAQKTGLLGGATPVVEAEVTHNDGPAQVTQVELANGFNEISVPANAKGVVIVFDPTTTRTFTLKGVTGDTGISVAGLAVLNFATAGSPTTIGITASGADTGKYTEFHWL